MKRMKRFLCMLLILSMVWSMVSMTVFAAGGAPFTDVKASDWFYNAVQYVYENSIMNGTGANTFSPYESTTRGMIVTILHRMEGTPSAEGAEFPDVSADQYYAAAVAWASANGIVSGYGNGNFGPNDNITREQMVTIFYRYAQYKHADTTAAADLSEYWDANLIDSYAKSAFAWAVAESIITGTSTATLDPAGFASRAQCAVVIQRYIDATHVHSWIDATCTAPKTCTTCGATKGDPQEHDYERLFSSDSDNIGSKILLKCKKCEQYHTYVVGEVNFTINDTLPDGNGEKVKVILLGGQSNASGTSQDAYLKQNVSAEKYAEYDSGYDNIYINYHISDGTYRSDGFVECATRQGEYGTMFGPELGLAEKLHELYPDETIFIIKYAWGGTNLFNQWLSPSTPVSPMNGNNPGVLYRQFVKFTEQSIQYLKSKNYDVEIEGMCWMQGESDSFSVENGTNYKAHLSNFIQDIRTQFAPYAAPDGIAFIDACIADNPMYWVYCDLVNASKQEVVKESPLNALIDTNAQGLTFNQEPAGHPDMAHYDSLSEIKLGHLFALELVNYMN